MLYLELFYITKSMSLLTFWERSIAYEYMYSKYPSDTIVYWHVLLPSLYEVTYWWHDLLNQTSNRNENSTWEYWQHITLSILGNTCSKIRVKKDCLWKQRTHKIKKIGDSVWLSRFICNIVVCEAAYALLPPPHPPPPQRQPKRCSIFKITRMDSMILK